MQLNGWDAVAEGVSMRVSNLKGGGRPLDGRQLGGRLQKGDAGLAMSEKRRKRPFGISMYK